MKRNMLSGKDLGESRKNAPSGSNHGVMLVIAGVTTFAILAIASFAVLTNPSLSSQYDVVKAVVV